jgi:hypothetical protein
MSRTRALLLRIPFALGLCSALAAVSCGRSTLGLLDDESTTLPGGGGAGGSADASAGDAKADGRADGAGGDGRADAGDVRTDARDGDAPADVKPDKPPGDTGACVIAADCDDQDACTKDGCYAGQCQYAPRDMDGDGHVAVECGGDDCNDYNPATYKGHAEVCGDGDDNDCNGVADCLDPACENKPGCVCVPDPGGENCSNGKDDDCDGFADCNDPGCAGTPACGCAPSETHCHDGADDDCDKLIDCDDPDCAADTLCACAGKTELCKNGKDDDCDLVVDCADSDCQSDPACTCVPPGKPEVCTNDKDDDCDLLVDCADPDCLYTPACQQCTPEKCTDGLDNDCNNLIDCADPACFLDPACAPVPEICNNGLDDDHDKLVDCEDPDCKNNPLCVIEQSNCLTAKLIGGSGTYTGNTAGHKNYTKGTCGGDAGEAVFYFVLGQPTKVHLDTAGTSFDSVIYIRRGACEDGKEVACDDDTGGQWAAQVDIPILYPGTYFVFVDGYTIDPQGGPNEGPFVLNVKLTPNPPEICDNGIDDDGDHYVDCADPNCTSVGKCLNCNAGKPPAPEFGPARCKDGQDNDCDGKADCKDDDCNASEYYKIECCNGTDDNGNQIDDEYACRCASNADCPSDNICYTHSAWSCGPPCTAFFGNVCPFVAPGSYCSTATDQCEFP